jgi:hypothetical protein
LHKATTLEARPLVAPINLKWTQVLYIHVGCPKNIQSCDMMGANKKKIIFKKGVKNSK